MKLILYETINFNNSSGKRWNLTWLGLLESDVIRA